MIYIAVIIYLLLLTYVYDYKKSTKGKNNHIGLLLLLFICIAGFRYRLGIDTIRYEWSFDQLPTFASLSFDDFRDNKYDPLYLLLSVAAKSIIPEFWMLQFMQAALVNVIVFRFFYKNTPHIFFSLLLYFVLIYPGYMMETMRESCAISMLLLGWESYKKDKYLQLFLFFVLAYLFHSSAIVLFVVFLLIVLRIDRHISFSFRTILVACLILAAGSFLQLFFIENIGLIAFSSRIVDKIDLYEGGDMFEQKINYFGIISNILLYAVIPFVCCRTMKGTKFFQKLEFFLVIEMLFAMMSVPIYIFYRYVGYFMPFVVMAVSNSFTLRWLDVPLLGKLRTKSIIAYLILVAPYFVNQYNVMTTNVRGSKYKNYMKIYPYANIFTKKLDPNREAVFSYYDL